MPTPMTDETITRALVALRARTIREGREGLEHVEALLAIRGVALERVQTKRPDNIFRRSQLRRLIYAALRSGPKTLAEIAEYVHAQRPSVSVAQAYQRASSQLTRMAQAGLLWHRKPLWGLADGVRG